MPDSPDSPVGRESIAPTAPDDRLADHVDGDVPCDAADEGYDLGSAARRIVFPPDGFGIICW